MAESLRTILTFPYPFNVTEIANLLQTFGGWGISALLCIVCRRLYADLRATEKARLDEARAFGERLHEGFEEAVGLVRRIDRPHGDQREELR